MTLSFFSFCPDSLKRSSQHNAAGTLLVTDILIDGEPLAQLDSAHRSKISQEMPSFTKVLNIPHTVRKIGVELARKMWGGGYQVLVATHFNTGTYHNHFVVNAVNMWDGRKFDCSKRAYYELRRLSDELCEEHGLSVIRAPGSWRQNTS